VNSRLVGLVDVLFGNEEDFAAALGYEISGVDESYSSLETTSYASMLGSVASDFPNLSVVATSLRTVRSATVNDWSGICLAAGRISEARVYEGVEIFDRIGGGDSFASGLIYGLQTGLTIDEALEYGVAHGALAMTTPGDTSMATLAEVKRLVSGRGARVRR
jgi:2-dehydro-3-deoxygluconokinase